MGVKKTALNEVELVIAGKTVFIRELNLRQIVRLSKLALSALSTISANLTPAQRERLMEGSVPENILVLVDILDEDQLASFFSILTGEEPGWCMENITPLVMVEILEAFARTNDIKTLIPKAKSLAQTLTGEMGQATT